MTSQHSVGRNGGGETLEDGIRSVLRRAQGNLSEQIHHCEESVRQSPANSIVIAGLAGYFLHILPIGALITGVLRLLTALLRPAMFLYAGAKLIDLVRTSSPSAKTDAH